MFSDELPEQLLITSDRNVNGSENEAEQQPRVSSPEIDKIIGLCLGGAVQRRRPGPDSATSGMWVLGHPRSRKHFSRSIREGRFGVSVGIWESHIPNKKREIQLGFLISFNFVDFCGFLWEASPPKPPDIMVGGCEGRTADS